MSVLPLSSSMQSAIARVTPGLAMGGAMAWGALRDDVEESIGTDYTDGENGAPIPNNDGAIVEIMSHQFDILTNVRTSDAKSLIESRQERIQKLNLEIAYKQPSKEFWGRVGPWFTRLLISGNKLAEDMTILDQQPIAQLQVMCDCTEEQLAMILRNHRLQHINSILVSDCRHEIEDRVWLNVHCESLVRFELRGRQRNNSLPMLMANKKAQPGLIVVVNGNKTSY